MATTSSGEQDLYAGTQETSEGRVFTVSGQDWDSISEGLEEGAEERVVVNMGPQHPSTHGVLRLILELEGETVTEARCGIGYLHTGIEKNMEFRSWTQGVTFCTRMDYLAPFYNEATYVLGVERLLDIEDDVPEKAQVMRVLLMELNRLSSHLVAIATGGMELGALTVMTIGFRERELVLDLFELITGLRMNHAFIRPGGVAQDLPPGALDEIRGFLDLMRKRLPEYAALCNANPIFKGRLEGVGHLDLEGCLALGLTGPPLRATGYPWDLRKSEPYCGYETYDFEIPVGEHGDCYDRYLCRMEEMQQSVGILRQALERLPDGPINVADPNISLPSKTDAMSDMESMIHHFKLITDGIPAPEGDCYFAIEGSKGELGMYLVAEEGDTKPVRWRVRPPSFVNLSVIAKLAEGHLVSDLIMINASLDIVLGEIDR